MGRIRLKSVYEKYDISDGLTILVDRLWPRGVRKSTPNVEIWMADIAPTDDPKKWPRFRQRYSKELERNSMSDELAILVAENHRVTFVYAASDHERNNAVV